MTSQGGLFDGDPYSSEYRRLDTPDAEFRLYEHAFTMGEADQLFDNLHHSTPWRADEILIHGKRVALPRLQAWYADGDHPLRYSGIVVAPLPMTAPLQGIRRRVFELTGQRFNGVLVTLYRDGNDSVGWHSDDESEFGTDPVIGSVSLGTTRDFVLRHRARLDLEPVKCPLTHGSLLMMGKGSQIHWHHQLPKRKRVREPRINLTLRTIKAPATN